jgi:basic membrane protein A and related proteins
MKKYVAIGAITAALIVSVSSGQQPIRVGMAFDAGGKNDKSFNQSAYEGAQRAAKDFKAEVKDFEPADPSQVGQGIRNFAQSGFDVVVGVGFANEPSITATAKDFKDVKFAVVDSVPAGDNTTGLVFREHEGSFLVGYIAGKTSSTGVVGFVGGMDIPLIHKFDAGYVAGVKAACPTCKVISNYVGTTPTAWNDPAKAKEIATNQNSQGADIIYAAAGASGLGVVNYIKDTKCVSSAKLPKGMKFKTMSADMRRIKKGADYSAKCKAADRPLFFIGVDANQNYLGDTDSNAATLNHGLTSMLKRVDVAVYNVIKDVAQAKTWKTGVREFGLENDGVGYAIDDYNKALVSAKTLADLKKIEADIIAGKVKVPSE